MKENQNSSLTPQIIRILLSHPQKIKMKRAAKARRDEQVAISIVYGFVSSINSGDDDDDTRKKRTEQNSVFMAKYTFRFELEL